MYKTSSNKNKPRVVLVIGSAPDAIRAKDFDRNLIDKIVVINNAWMLRNDWDYLIHPEDFPVARRPISICSSQQVITAEDYVPVQNYFGGFVYAGGTMSFTSAYWALGALKPDIICFIGCDMVYPKNGLATHFYGIGSPDPLRVDVTLQSLEAKSSRLFYLALKNSCLCVNLSDLPESRLTFPRISLSELEMTSKKSLEIKLREYNELLNLGHLEDIIKYENNLGYYFESGRYWEHLDNISSDNLKEIDNFWLENITI